MHSMAELTAVLAAAFAKSFRYRAVINNYLNCDDVSLLFRTHSKKKKQRMLNEFGVGVDARSVRSGNAFSVGGIGKLTVCSATVFFFWFFGVCAAAMHSASGVSAN
jgi:hypothetical protein